MDRRSLLICAALAVFSGYGQATQLYMMPQKVLPLHTNPSILLGYISYDDIHLEKVQQIGDITKWKQTLNGIPIYGSVITTHTHRNGKIDRVQGFIGTSKYLPAVDQKPDISIEVALDLIKVHWKHAGLRDVNWIYSEPRAKLNILQTDDGNKLVWRTSYFVDWADDANKETGFGPVPSYIIGLVNAHTGKVEKTWNNLQSVDVKGILGNEKIGNSSIMMDVEQEEDNKWCRHRNKENRVEVFSLGNKKRWSNITKSAFICERANTMQWDQFAFTDGYSPRNEAFIYGNYFVELWNHLVGEEIRPHRTNTSDLQFYTHYGVEYNNAYFNGWAFLIGDGHDDGFYPLSSLDVICHEIGHAITDWHGGDMEYYDEMGGINEAYSDILALTCNMYYKKRKDYLIGADVMRPGEAEALRDMCNPKRFGGLDHYKDYEPGVDVHYSSGIYNKAFCTLSKTKYWDYIKAFYVFNTANLMFWNPTTSMHCGACGVESAANDLRLSVEDVQSAFDVVGISCRSCKKL